MPKKIYEILFTITEESLISEWFYTQETLERDIKDSLAGLEVDTSNMKVKTELIRIKEVS